MPAIWPALYIHIRAQRRHSSFIKLETMAFSRHALAVLAVLGCLAVIGCSAPIVVFGEIAEDNANVQGAISDIQAVYVRPRPLKPAPCLPAVASARSAAGWPGRPPPTHSSSRG